MRMRWPGHVAGVIVISKAHKILVGKCDGRTPLGRTKHRKEDNIKLYFKYGVYRIHLAMGRDKW
jgi:hypothetical protein